jgi:hypothetical protein
MNTVKKNKVVNYFNTLFFINSAQIQTKKYIFKCCIQIFSQ